MASCTVISLLQVALQQYSIGEDPGTVLQKKSPKIYLKGKGQIIQCVVLNIPYSPPHTAAGAELSTRPPLH